MASRRAQIPRARAVVEEELERFRGVARGRSVAPLVAALRSHAEEVRRGELDRIGAGLAEDERARLEEVTRRLVAKLLHEPTVRLKESAGSPKGERLAEALRALYDL